MGNASSGNPTPENRENDVKNNDQINRTSEQTDALAHLINLSYYLNNRLPLGTPLNEARQLVECGRSLHPTDRPLFKNLFFRLSLEIQATTVALIEGLEQARSMDAKDVLIVIDTDEIAARVAA